MRRKKFLTLSFMTIFFVICVKYFFRLRLNPADESFTDIGSCPACYGKSLCPNFFHGDVSLIGGSKLKYLQFLNRKNVYYGKLGSKRIVLKKLAHDWEVRESDRIICSKSGASYPCNVSSAIMHLVRKVPHGADYISNVLQIFNATTDIARCPSERLLSHIYSKITFEDKSMGITSKSLERVAEMMYGIFVNPESVILQAFTQSEGWPFPNFIGSCGRTIAVEYVGPTLLHFEFSPWIHRLDLSYQLLQIAQQMTNNDHQFALYLTDVNMDNFAVRPDGTLLLVDVESIIIVDRLKIRSGREKHWDRVYSSKGEACRDCFNFSFEDLCSHDSCDHNYYAICRGLLIPNSYYSYQGLLHDIPADVEQKTNLSALLKECAFPKSDIGRYIMVPKLLQVMKSLL